MITLAQLGALGDGAAGRARSRFGLVELAVLERELEQGRRVAPGDASFVRVAIRPLVPCTVRHPRRPASAVPWCAPVRSTSSPGARHWLAHSVGLDQRRRRAFARPPGLSGVCQGFPQRSMGNASPQGCRSGGRDRRLGGSHWPPSSRMHRRDPTGRARRLRVANERAAPPGCLATFSIRRRPPSFSQHRRVASVALWLSPQRKLCGSMSMVTRTAFGALDAVEPGAHSTLQRDTCPRAARGAGLHQRTAPCARWARGRAEEMHPRRVERRARSGDHAGRLPTLGAPRCR